jgi:amino acid permease
MRGLAAHWAAFIGTVVFTIGYIVAVLFCGLTGRSLDAETNANFWYWVTFGRMLTVVMFALVTIATIYVHRRDQLRKQKGYQ